MIEINAAILERSFTALERKMKLAANNVDMVQIDVCDGRFVPSKTVMSAGCPDSARRIHMLARRHDVRVELDMMIDWDVSIKGRFEKWLCTVNTIQPERVVLHYGSTERLDEILGYFTDTDIEFGLGVHLDSDLDTVHGVLAEGGFTYVQVMGIEKVGFGGQALSDKVYEVLGRLRADFPTLPLAVDGGVKRAHARMLVDAGATRLTVGSGIFNDCEDMSCIVDSVKAFRAAVC